MTRTAAPTNVRSPDRGSMLRSILLKSPAQAPAPIARSRQARPVMRGAPIDNRTSGHDPRGVDARMRQVVMALDVVEIHRIAEAGPPEQVACISPQIRVVDEAPQVAFEVQVIHGVEADERCEQPD